MTNKIELCKVTDVKLGEALKIEKEGLVLAVFNIDSEFFVTDDLCTHGPGSLSEGWVLDDLVECNFHNGAFNIKTGEAVTAPCTEKLRTYQVVVENQLIYILI